jgi:putative FmdB family regulatory protein
MPAYDYRCERCGIFTVVRPMAVYQEPHDCPGCGALAPRVIVRPPQLAGMDKARRTAFATNERAAHEPKQGAAPGHGHSHGPGSGRDDAARPPRAAKSFPSARPWMISH